MKAMQYIPRWILTAVLLFFVYHETGVFTVFTLALITVAIELNSYVNTKYGEIYYEILTKLTGGKEE